MEIIVACPQCDYELHLPNRELLGRKGKCPNCAHKFVMENPKPAAAKPQPPPQPPEKPKPLPPKPKPAAPQPQPDPEPAYPRGNPPTDSSPLTPPTDFDSIEDPDPTDEDSKSNQTDTPTVIGAAPGSDSDSAAVPDELWDELQSEPPAEPSPSSSTGPSTRVVARCPHCHVAVDFRRDDELRDYPCERCGRHFSLIHPEAPPDAIAMPPKVGNYPLQKHPRIGVGPFGNVYRAKDGQSQESIVIKVARGDQVSEAETEKFLATLRSVMQLKHPNIAALHELDVAEGRVYLVSHYVTGVDLSEYLLGAPDRKLSFREAASLCALIASVLHHAHKFGVIHGNLKPSNIRLDGNQKPYLMDFGLNHRKNGVHVTGNGRIVGSAAYLAPEQLPGNHREPDPQTDVFALGVMFYELLTGFRPFPGEDTELFQQIARGNPAHPRSIHSKIPKPLDIICRKCLELNPRDRYQTAMEVYKELRLYLEDKPIKTKPPGLVARLGRWCRRRPMMAGLLLTVLFLALISAGFVGWRIWQQGGFS